MSSSKYNHEDTTFVCSHYNLGHVTLLYIESILLGIRLGNEF